MIDAEKSWGKMSFKKWVDLMINARVGKRFAISILLGVVIIVINIRDENIPQAMLD